MAEPRDRETREADTLAMLSTEAIDVWVATTSAARLAVGPTRDVVMIDAVLDKAVDVGADHALGAAYAAQADWGPRRSTGYVFLVLQPVRIQAWREASETEGRTLVRHGSWVV